MSEVRRVTKHLFERYLSLVPSQGQITADLSFQQLQVLCQTGIDKSFTLPIDKLNRHLGFIQAVLIIHKLTDINTERDYSRPLFHAAYKADGIETPPTINVMV